MNRADLQHLAEERLEDAQILFANNRFGAAYYLVGYAVECGLKACIAKLTKAEDFYDKGLARNIFKHDLEQLANYARFDVRQFSQADPDFATKLGTGKGLGRGKSLRDAFANRGRADDQGCAGSGPWSYAMYKTVLVSQMLEDGAEVLKKLDDRGIPVPAAAWFDDPEKQSWKLVIATSVAENPGPLEAYTQIQYAMSGLPLSFALDDVIVMSPSSRKFEEFRRIMEGAGRGESLNPKPPSTGVAFDDAYVYRWLVK